MVYSDTIEFTRVVKTKTLLLRSITFISKVKKNGNLISTAQ